MKYLESRGIGADWYDFMYSTDKGWDVYQRLLIPFYWRGDIVGFSGRMFENLPRSNTTQTYSPAMCSTWMHKIGQGSLYW